MCNVAAVTSPPSGLTILVALPEVPVAFDLAASFQLWREAAADRFNRQMLAVRMGIRARAQRWARMLRRWLAHAHACKRMAAVAESMAERSSRLQLHRALLAWQGQVQDASAAADAALQLHAGGVRRQLHTMLLAWQHAAASAHRCKLVVARAIG